MRWRVGFLRPGATVTLVTSLKGRESGKPKILLPSEKK